MKVAITGAEGFLGWHLSCRLAATRGLDPVRLTRDDFADPSRLAARLEDVDTIIHMAGVNRAESAEAVEQGNVAIARALVEASGERAVHVVYANSIQADHDNPYGRGKRQAAAVLAEARGSMVDVMLPNLFGEHGRAAYNSFVATFCHEVAAGREPRIIVDNQVPLLHAQDAAEILITAAEQRGDRTVRPKGTARRVSEVLLLIQSFHRLYAEWGEIPDVSDVFVRDLFNTYRSYLFPENYPIFPVVHADRRGALVEAVRSHGGTGHTFASTTPPGEGRGDHYHLRKIERFMVMHGGAEIALRRLYDDRVITFRIDGARPGFIDMPTMWAHNIRNVGASDLVTVFWADQLLDPDNPDQFPLAVKEQA